ncbi:MAG: ATP-dependent sacrificial sulfur transferase LarE [Candidatus Nanopelagicales bacterium]
MTSELGTPDPLESLLANVQHYPGLVVAFSGGVDSAFLLAAAMRALGPGRVLAVTAVSPSLPAAELSSAREFAASLGVPHLEVATDEMSRDGYRENSTARCYFCKAELLDVVSAVVPHGWYVATGTNADDRVAGFRPGIRAAAQRGALTPLADVGLDKATIRATARQWGLSVWDKPQAACLSSRVAYGIQISTQRLARVEAAERAVRELLGDPGVNLRVRDLGDTARIEVDAALLAVPGWQQAARQEVLSCGFASVEIDPRGFRSGSMNEGLSSPSAPRRGAGGTATTATAAGSRTPRR